MERENMDVYISGQSRRGKQYYPSPFKMALYTIIIYYLLTMTFGMTLFLIDDQYREILINSWHESIIWTLIFTLLGGLYLMAFSALGFIALIMCILKQVRLYRLIIAVVLAINLPFWLISLWHYCMMSLDLYPSGITFMDATIITGYGIFAPTFAMIVGYLFSCKG